MKALLVAVLVVIAGIIVIGFASGWITVQKHDDRTTIDIDTREMRSTADEAVEEGKEALHDVKSGLQRLGDAPPSPDKINNTIREEVESLDNDADDAVTVPSATPHSTGPDDSI